MVVKCGSDDFVGHVVPCISILNVIVLSVSVYYRFIFIPISDCKWCFGPPSSHNNYIFLS